MTDIFNIGAADFKAFLLILIRVSSLLFMFPFFEANMIPVLVKAGLAFITALVLLPVVQIPTATFPATPGGIVLLVASELIVGMTLGLLVKIFFEGVQMMGQMVGFQTGFAITNIIDPQSGVQVSIMANLAYWVAILVFLLINGHHLLLQGVRDSFALLPPGSLRLNAQMLPHMIRATGEMFVIALKIGAPAMAALLFTKVIFGVITKFIPQMNIMIVAFPVQVFVGLVFFGISLNLLLVFTRRYVEGLAPLMAEALHWIRM